MSTFPINVRFTLVFGAPYIEAAEHIRGLTCGRYKLDRPRYARAGQGQH